MSIRVSLAAGFVVLLTVAGGPRAFGECVTEESDKLTASDASTFDRFGMSVSVSGNTAVVGASMDDDNGRNSGSAYVFQFDPEEGWVEDAKLRASDGESGDSFGYSVAVDGDVAVVGAYGNSDVADRAGAAYVFRRLGDVWVQDVKLVAYDGAVYDWFGRCVAISGDVVVVGAWRDDDAGTESGSAYVYRYDAGSWGLDAKLTASDAAANDWFGISVAVSGNVVVVGARWDDDNGLNSGSAYVFAFDGVDWEEEAKLTASDGAVDDSFGYSVAVDGDVAVIGAFQDDDNGADSGSAYVFRYDGDSWDEEAKLVAEDGVAGDSFGLAVAAFGDAAMIGAPDQDCGGEDSGAAYLFTYDGTGWGETAKLIAADAAVEDRLGTAVAVSADIGLAATYGDDDNGADSGSVYEFAGLSIDCNENFAPDFCDVMEGGDFDSDDDVDLDDYAALVDCLAGPEGAPSPAAPECVDACLFAFDTDDDDVDLTDVAAFANALSAP